MFHAPVSDSKQQADPARANLAPERQDADRTFDGAHALGRVAARLPPPSMPAAARKSHMARLQRAYGNQAVLRMLALSRPAIQPKLVVNEPGDAYEQEADRVADQVMRMPDPALSIAPAPAKVSRECAECEEEDKKNLQMKPAAAPDAGGTEAPPIVHEVLRSPGEPLDPGTRAFFEPRFGYDFSGVRVHTDAKAAKSTGAVRALAYTVGQDIVFRADQYIPDTQAGKRLLAHELTHVVQQAQGQSKALQSQSDDDGATQLQAGGLVPLTGVTVNHNRVTVPPVAGLSFSATKTPANASGVTLSIAGDNATIAAGTSINSATGAIKVAPGQTGGSAHVQADQNATDSQGNQITASATAPFNFAAIPSGITSTSASPSGLAGFYGGDFTHTFTSPAGGQAALELSHVNEQFAAASGTTLTITGPLTILTITINNPNSAAAGWDLDSSGTMAGPDHVNWSNSVDARPFVANASHPSPSSGLPQALTVTQNFRNLTFPNQAYGAAAVASTTHRRAIEDRSNQLKAVTSANAAGISQEIVEDYAGPTVFRRCRATPASIPVAAPPPPGTDAGAAPAAATSTITVDAEGVAATPTFSIRPPNLGCTITSGGVLTPGTTPGMVTIRAGGTANFDETTVTLTAPPATPTPSPSPAPSP